MDAKKRITDFLVSWAKHSIVTLALEECVGSVGQLIKIAMLRVKNALPFLEC
jgi:hypothetical protein